MNSSVLNVGEQALYDNSIVNAEKHTHQPYASTTLNSNDEIRIPIQQQDTYTLPWASVIYIEGKVTPATGVQVINNGIAHLFEEIRYEINGVVIDRVRNPGITTTLKSYVSYNKNESVALANAGWYPCVDKNKTTDILDSNGNFNVCMPLKMVLGFAEDFRKIIMNLRQELVLIRSSTDSNAILSASATTPYKVELSKVQWKIPHISVADAERLMLMKYIEREVELEMAFRSWELTEYPVLQQTKRHTWAVKTATHLEKPRFIIVAFQTNKKNNIALNMSEFENCKLSNIKLYLNSEIYPYDNLNLDFSKNHYALLYEMY